MSIQTDDFGTPSPARMVDAKPETPQEEAIERALRPKLLDDYVGQAKVREQLEIFIGAAKMRGEPLDHVLLFGPPGLGKTTLSHIIAAELGVNLRQTSGPVLEKPKDLAALLTNLEKNDVLFIDEIHRLSPVVEEILYPALEDYQIDIMIGEGPAARSIKLDLQPFTLVGATTRAGMLTNPLRDRFGIVSRLEFYTAEELGRIVKRSAALLKAPMDAAGGEEIAKRSRGTPRIANRLLRRVRDGADVTQGCFAQTRRAEEQHMVQRLAAHFGGANENFELLTNLGLPHIVVKQFRAQSALNGFFLRCLGFCVHHARGRWGAKVVGLNAHGVILFG